METKAVQGEAGSYGESEHNWNIGRVGKVNEKIQQHWEREKKIDAKEQEVDIAFGVSNIEGMVGEIYFSIFFLKLFPPPPLL